MQSTEKAYSFDEEHTNKEVTVQYNELKLSWADKCKEKTVQDIVVPAASKFSDLMKGSQGGNIEKKSSDSPLMDEKMYTEIMKEMTTSDGKGGSNISTSAGISMIDNLKGRLEEMLVGNSLAETESTESKGKLRNHDMFLDAALEVLEGDSNTRVYFRTSGALTLLLTHIRNGLTGIKEAKEDNRSVDFSSLGKHMKLLAVAISNERSSKLQLLEDTHFIADLKQLCSLGDVPGELLEGYFMAWMQLVRRCALKY